MIVFNIIFIIIIIIFSVILFRIRNTREIFEDLLIKDLENNTKYFTKHDRLIAELLNVIEKQGKIMEKSYNIQNNLTKMERELYNIISISEKRKK